MMLRIQKKWWFGFLLLLFAALLVGHYFFAWVTIDGNSMWPLLRDGETRFLSRDNDPAAVGDIAVFEHDGHWIVKTVAFVGPGWFSIRDADLYGGVSRNGMGRMRLDSKRLLNRTQEILSELSESALNVTAGIVSVSDDKRHLLLNASDGPARVVLPKSGFLLPRMAASGRISRGALSSRDVLIGFAMPSPQPEAELLLTVLLNEHEWGGVLCRSVESGWAVSLGANTEPIIVAGRARVTIGFVDGAAWLIREGHPDQKLGALPQTAPAELSQIAFEAKGTSIVLSHITVRGDSHWGVDMPEPVFVPTGHVFLLGENPPISTDSRVFGPVSQDRIIGRLELEP